MSQMQPDELKKLSEKWGVDLVGFENTAIVMKHDYMFHGESEAKSISKILEKRGYRLRGVSYSPNDCCVLTFEDGTYGFSSKVPSGNNFKYKNLKDLKGEQIMDKNLFFGFIYGFISASILFAIFSWIF